MKKSVFTCYHVLITKQARWQGGKSKHSKKIMHGRSRGERTSEEHELHVRVLVPDAGAAGEGCKGAVENVNRCIVLAQPPPQLSNLQAPVT